MFSASWEVHLQSKPIAAKLKGASGPPNPGLAINLVNNERFKPEVAQVIKTNACKCFREMRGSDTDTR